MWRWRSGRICGDRAFLKPEVIALLDVSEPYVIAEDWPVWVPVLTILLGVKLNPRRRFYCRLRQ